MAPSLLWASPLPPVHSGVSDHAVELLSELVERATVRVVRPPDWSPPDDLPVGVHDRLVPSDTVPEPDEIPIVHLGNNPHHIWLLDLLRRWPPSLVVLHDQVLHHLLVEATLGTGDAHAYATALRADHPAAGPILTEAREHGISGRMDPFWYPARRWALEGARGVIVHSRDALDRLRRELPGVRVAQIRLAVAGPEGGVDRRRERERLGLSGDEPVAMHLGFPTAHKGLDTILAGLSAARAAGVAMRFVVVGEEAAGATFRRAVECSGLGGAVISTGWLPIEALRRVPAAADLGVVIRTPSAGETSAAAGRFLACGTPVAITARAQFLELPAAVAPRVTPGPSAAADLARAMIAVAASKGSEEESARRGECRAAWTTLYRPDLAADDLLAAVSVTA